VLFAFALLAYEPMLFYAGVYPALFLYRHFSVPKSALKRADWFQLLQTFTRRNWFLACVVVGYMVTYFVYRSLQPTFGRGVDGSGKLMDILVTIYKFSVNGFHLQIKALTNYIAGDSAPHTLWLALLYSIAIASGCLLLFPKVRDAYQPGLLYRKWSLAVLGFYVFCPNMLHGLLEMYRLWAADDPHYVGNYFSSFPLAMLVTLGLLSQVGGRKAMQEKVLFVAVVGVLATSACDNFIRWGNLAQRNRMDSQLWQQAVADLRTQSLNTHKPTVLCGLHAPEKVSGDERYWSGYLTEVLGKPVSYFYKNLSAVPCDVQLDFNRYRFAAKQN
jgi:hypothetical protein